MENVELNNREMAFVLDGKVVELTICDTRFASILLSNPLVLDVTGLGVNLNFDYNYQTGKLFTLNPSSVEVFSNHFLFFLEIIICLISFFNPYV